MTTSITTLAGLIRVSRNMNPRPLEIQSQRFIRFISKSVQQRAASSLMEVKAANCPQWAFQNLTSRTPP